MSIIILEGSDGSGKSTIAKKLSRELGYEVVQGSSFEISELGADGMFEYMYKLLDKENVIIDRFMFSNLVYGKKFGYPLMSDEQFDALAEKIEDVDAIVLYVYTHPAKIEYRLKSRGDEKIDFDKNPNYIKEIQDDYANELQGDFRPRLLLTLDNNFKSDIEYISNVVKKIV